MKTNPWPPESTTWTSFKTGDGRVFNKAFRTLNNSSIMHRYHRLTGNLAPAWRLSGNRQNRAFNGFHYCFISRLNTICECVSQILCIQCFFSAMLLENHGKELITPGYPERPLKALGKLLDNSPTDCALFLRLPHFETLNHIELRIPMGTGRSFNELKICIL